MLSDTQSTGIMSEGDAKPTANWRVVVFVVLGLAVVGVIFAIFQLQKIPVGLKYDATRTFTVGGHKIGIETRSFVFGNGDEGHAEVVVSGVDFEVVLDSQFNNDLFMDVRPAYVSWDRLDGDWRRDLLVWKPANISGLPLVASEYVSSVDGKLYALNPPRHR